jgi:hypothetical protein
MMWMESVMSVTSAEPAAIAETRLHRAATPLLIDAAGRATAQARAALGRLEATDSERTVIA